VELTYDTSCLWLRVSDNGRGSSPDAVPGHGLFGMRQRATLLGGELTAGPGPDGGFQVPARLPVDGESP
jgi:signal transduction histidine kinase